MIHDGGCSTSRQLWQPVAMCSTEPRPCLSTLAVQAWRASSWTREDWIDQGWSIVDPVASRLADHPPQGLLNYAAGSGGPKAAAGLIERDGLRWKPA
jgi:hypothetical protein